MADKPANLANASSGVPETKEEDVLPSPTIPTQPPKDGDDLIFGPSGFLSETTKDANLEKLLISIVEYAKYRKERLDSASKSNDTEIQRLKSLMNSHQTEINRMKTAGISSGAANMAKTEKDKNFAERINEMIDTRTRTLESLEVVKTQIIKYCGPDKTSLKDELEKNIRAAIENLRKEVSGDSGDVIRIRREIEKYLPNFAESWQSFKNSYQLNICLTGGAGVGKSTLARAAAKCFHAFGILGSDVFKEPEPRDFIAEYIGQTTPKTFGILYAGLEGVVFIDEAYAIGQTDRFGQEFIDALVLFTQKFPGHISIIVAGYKKDMEEHFFKKNEGLNRRFPNQFELLPYPFSTINNAIIATTGAKLSLPVEKRPTVAKTLQFHSFLASLAYLDTSDVSSDDPGALFNAHLTRYFPDYFSNLAFNLEPLIRMLYLTNNVQKRDVMKAYILKYKFGIPPADLFPNQMGDVQNLVSEILKQDNVIRGGAVTFMDAVAALNNYFKIRDPHRFQIVKVAGGVMPTRAGASASSTPTPPTSSEQYIIHFCPHAQSPSTFEANVLRPLFGPLLEKDGAPFDFFADISDDDDIKRISNYVDKLYTTAIQQFSKDFEEQSNPKSNVIKLPGSIRYAFVKQQMDLLNFEIKSRQEKGGVIGAPVLLSYFDAKSSDVSDIFNVAGAEKLSLPPGKALTEICAEIPPSSLLPIESTPEPPTVSSMQLVGSLLKPAAVATRPATTGGGGAIPVFEAREIWEATWLSTILYVNQNKFAPLKAHIDTNKEQTYYKLLPPTGGANAKPPPPDVFIVPNATLSRNCDVKFKKVSADVWRATLTDGRDLKRTKLKRSELQFDVQDEDDPTGSLIPTKSGSEIPVSFHLNYQYHEDELPELKEKDPEFETEIVTLSCSKPPHEPSPASPPLTSVVSPPVPPPETSLGATEIPVLTVNGKIFGFADMRTYLGFITASDFSYLYSMPSENKDEILFTSDGKPSTLPETFILKNTTISGNCDVKFTTIYKGVWKVTQMDGQNLKKRQIKKGELNFSELDPEMPALQPSPQIKFDFPLSYHSNYTKDITDLDDLSDDSLTEIFEVSCSEAEPRAGGAASGVAPPKERRFGMKTRRGRKQRRGTTRKT